MSVDRYTSSTAGESGRSVRRVVGVVLLALAVPSLLAACGGRDSSSGSSTPGITDTTVKIGTSAPLSGPLAAYSAASKAAAAYFDYVNAQGGVKMADGKTRKIEVKVEDDAYDPSRTASNVRDLVDNYGAFGIFQVVGSATNLSVYNYLNEKKVPQVFSYSGTGDMNDPKRHPWTMQYNQSYELEARALTNYLLKTVPDPKVAMLTQGDAFGKSVHTEFTKAFAEAGIQVVGDETYDPTATNVDSQMLALKNSGANAFVDYAIGTVAIQAIKAKAKLGWEPAAWVNGSASVSVAGTFTPAGPENAKGAAAVFSNKDPGDSRWADDPGLVQYKDIITKYGDGLDYKDSIAAAGFLQAQLLVQALADTKAPTRQAFMDAVQHLDFTPGLLFPGAKIETSPDYPYAQTQVQVQVFDGSQFQPVGGIFTLKSPLKLS
jgi:branched-chain amino acid transport system substrate-binding protein